MGTIIKIIMFIIGLFRRKPRPLGDTIVLDDREEEKKWKKELKDLEDEKIKLQEKANQAYIDWVHDPACNYWDIYDGLRGEIESKAREINRHNANHP